MSKKDAIKLLGGTLARGVLWATGALAAKIGIENIDENTGAAIGMFIAAAIVTAVAAHWSKKKNQLLLDTSPS